MFDGRSNVGDTRTGLDLCTSVLSTELVIAFGTFNNIAIKIILHLDLTSRSTRKIRMNAVHDPLYILHFTVGNDVELCRL